MRPRLAHALLATVTAAVVTASHVGAQRVVPPPEWAESVEVVNDAAPVLRAPSPGAERRGTVRVHTRLPLVARVPGEGCADGMWVQVGEAQFICEQHVRYSRGIPGGEPLPQVEPGELLPREYAFVAFDGTRAYAHPRDMLADDYVQTLGEGFGVVVVGRTMFDGAPFVQTRSGLWLHADAIRRARGSDFAGVSIERGAPLDVAWVAGRSAPVHERPHGRVVRRAGRREIVHVAEETGRSDWLRLTDGTYMRDRHLLRAVPVARPEGVGPRDKWIDVNVEEQVLVAYEGTCPVFATLVSTGRASRTHATPLGVHRIWAKLAFSDMDDLGRDDVESNYSIAQVPWVQYFEGGNGLHAAFWHDEFGRRRSHGCVNLSPRDARFLFDWTDPVLPVGWKAILPGEADRSTAILVR